MYYHASPVGGITQLEPRVSNHHVPLIYFSKKRENVLVYLCNAVERYCKDTHFPHRGLWRKWASYGFDRDGIQRIEEYYPDALKKTYLGVSGYIYSVADFKASNHDLRIPDAAATGTPVRVLQEEYIPDAYLAILEAEQQGLLRITRYEEMTEATRIWLHKTIPAEFQAAADHPEYRHFLRGNFPEFLGG